MSATFSYSFDEARTLVGLISLASPEEYKAADSLNEPFHIFPKIWIEREPDPYWVELLTNTARVIVPKLEHAALHCLDQLGASNSFARNDAEHLSDCIKLAKKLRTALKVRNPAGFRPSSVLLPLKLENLILGSKRSLWNDVAHNKRTTSAADMDLFEALLGKIINNGEKFFAQLPAEQHSDRRSKEHNKAFNTFVDRALFWYGRWTLKKTGGSKSGGSPASRFLCAAANPVIHYANVHLGLQLRRGGILDETSAGEIVARYSKRRRDRRSVC